MARSRTTKTIAKRIDLGYFKRPHPMRTWRRVLTWSAGAIALAWIGFEILFAHHAKNRLNDRVFNPGHLSAAHAMFENDCKQCHEPKPGGGFFLAVTDSACIKCHDGAIHNSNQKIAAETSLVSFSSKLLAINEGGHPRSADCVSCHVEHRGETMLAARSDAHCIVCHADLSASSQNAKPQAANRIVAFSLTDHPAFGRKLHGVDPTVLKFDHKYHLEKVDDIRNNSNSCQMCHVPDPQDRRYMLPVSYAKNCQSCHELKPLSDVNAAVAHTDLSIVRFQLLNMGPLFLQSLHALPKDQHDAALTKKVQSGRKTTTQTITEDQWVTDKIAAVTKAASEWLDSDEAKKTPGFEQAKTDDAHTLESFVAFGMSQSCAKCHELKLNDSSALTTVPTGIGTMPRRWFASSQFDHDAHRNMSCNDCHAAAMNSSATSDLLLPGIEHCVQCHHPATRASLGAGSDCVMCHSFHDRALDRVASISPSPGTPGEGRGEGSSSTLRVAADGKEPSP